MKYYWAIDIGGTAIKYGVVDQTGRVLKREETPTQAQKGGAHLMQKVESLLRELSLLYPEAVGIGVSTAGQVDVQRGSIRFATEALPGWTGMPIRERLEQAFGLPVHVENDVNAAALGEAWKGAGQGHRDLLCLTIGTGIGGAIVLDRKVYYGHGGSAAEFGHIRHVRDGRPCTCGQNGCLEQYAATTALVREAERQLRVQRGLETSLNGRMVFEKVHAGDALFVRVFQEWVDHLAYGLSTLCHTFNPSLIVLGGGVSAQGDFLLQPLQERLNGYLMPSFREGLTLRMASCGNDAGMLGAVFTLAQ